VAERQKVRVLVIGAGPAGLAAAARVLERGGGSRFRVRLATLGHHLGGKASSWRDDEGRLIDHGQHIVAGFYKEMKALIRRAGVDVEARLVSNQGGSNVYEDRDGKVHALELHRNPIRMLFGGLGYTGLTRREKLLVAKFGFANLSIFLGLQDVEQFDDVCFTSWCLANGLCPSVVQTNLFRTSRVGQMNWPGEISAYSMLKTMRIMARDYRTAEYSFPDGGMTERFWEPIMAHIMELGGELEPMRKLTALHRDGDRLAAVTFAEPDSAGHDKPERRAPGDAAFEGAVPGKPGSDRVDRDFDYVISTVPVSAFQELNAGDEDFWSLPAFAGIRNLRGVAGLGMQVWHRARLGRRYHGAILGLPGPLPVVHDNKHVIREYREDPRYGAVLYFAGQETGYESFSDEDLLAQSLANVAKLPGYEPIDRAGILHWQVVRHRTPSTAYFLTEPGVQKFRPHARTPLANFMLAGDWVRSDLDFPCMEAAVRTGLAAADAVLEKAS
jgi:uncharacterized protein with NAD-binding domain and iron-sulfur cluster